MLAALIPGARFLPLESRSHLVLATEPAWRQLMVELDNFLPGAGSGKNAAALTQQFDRARNGSAATRLRGARQWGEVAARLGISEKTVRNHVSIVLGKLGVSNRAQAMVRARDAGLGRG
jgi:hypothetical protein